MASTNRTRRFTIEGDDRMAATTLTTTEVAAELGTDPRTLRKFLRDSRGEGKAVVGKGARYSFEKREIRSLKSQFGKWLAAREAEKAAADNTPEEVTEDES